MQQQQVSNIKALTILHFSLLIGQLVFAAIAYYLHYSGKIQVVELGSNQNLILQVIGAVCLLLTLSSFFVYRKKAGSIKDAEKSPAEKLNAYRAANLIRWAMLEAPVLLAIIAFMLTGNYNLLILAGAILVMFIATRPSVSKATSELAISESEVNG